MQSTVWLISNVNKIGGEIVVEIVLTWNTLSQQKIENTMKTEVNAEKYERKGKKCRANMGKDIKIGKRRKKGSKCIKIGG